jgi:signal transduction histidine kinase
MLESDRARISVLDEGPGIPEEFRTRIFGRFSQAESSEGRRVGGTGLGLHIAQQMVERMGGRIGFDTELGRGTTFWVEFPMIRIAEN